MRFGARVDELKPGIVPVSNEKPLVSVVIPNLNGKTLLGDCLRSLERQSFKDFEVILSLGFDIRI